MRCYSAALRCQRPAAEDKGERRGGNGRGGSEEKSAGTHGSSVEPAVAPAPFSSEELLTQPGSLDNEVVREEEMGLEDLLSISENAPAGGAILVDTKWKTAT